MIKTFAVVFDCDETVTKDTISMALGEYFDNKHDGSYLSFDVVQIFPKQE